MKKSAISICRITLVIVLSATSMTVLLSQDLEKEKQAIRELYFEMSQALIDKDWKLYQSFWFHDTSLNVIHPEIRDWAKGWKAVETMCKPYFSPEVNMQVELSADVFDVYIAPSREFAWSLIDIKVIMGEQVSESWQVTILRKIDGKWRVNLAFDAGLPPEQSQ